MPWLNEPPEWRLDGDTLTVTTAAETDVWRVTHYGFVHDNAHLWYQPVEGDFTAEVRFTGQYEHLYDQAGLMLRLDERTWIKSGIEYTDGQQHLSAVVTRDFSDWSVLPLDDPPPEIRLRLTRIGTAVFVDYALGDGQWRMLRLAYLPEAARAMVGPMCCSPLRAGFRVRFDGFTVGQAIPRTDH